LNLFFPTFPTFPTFLFAICLPRLLDVLDADENELNFAIEMLTPPGGSDAEVPETALGLRHALVLRRVPTHRQHSAPRVQDAGCAPSPRLGSIVTRIKLGSRSDVATPRAASRQDPPGSRDTPEGALRPRPRPA
jgi:hypothetical protein